MAPHLDAFRRAHNLDRLAALVAALSARGLVSSNRSKSVTLEPKMKQDGAIRYDQLNPEFPSPNILSVNIMHFARILRRAGLPIGQDQVLAALEALQVIDIGHRDDVYWALHAMLIRRHAHSELFRAAFERFWTAPVSGVSSDIADDNATSFSPDPEPVSQPRRITDAFGSSHSGNDSGLPADKVIAASWSSAERLRTQDFETMSAEEWSEAKRLIATLRLPIPDVVTRRFHTSHNGSRIDMRATLRAVVRSGGAWDLKRKARVRRPPPLVVLCDVSGSMAAYARMLLHFLHAITNDRDRVHTFLYWNAPDQCHPVYGPPRP